MIYRSTSRILDGIAPPHPAVYTSESACNNFCERLQRQIVKRNDPVMLDIAPINTQLLYAYDVKQKASVDYVDAYYKNLTKAIRTVAADDTITETRTVRKIQRQINVSLRNEILIPRGTMALTIKGLLYEQSRHFYRRTSYDPHVRLTVHALARFMYRAKAPPHILIERLARLASFARLLSDNDTHPGPIALAIPEGLIHGRIGHSTENDRFAWQCDLKYNFVIQRLFRDLIPECTHGNPKAIDLITFLPYQELNPYLSALHAALTDLYEATRTGAEIAYGLAFAGQTARPEERTCLDEARTAARRYLASDLHRGYRTKQDDRDTAALIARLNQESACVPGETAMMAALAAARQTSRQDKGDKSSRSPFAKASPPPVD